MGLGTSWMDLGHHMVLWCGVVFSHINLKFKISLPSPTSLDSIYKICRLNVLFDAFIFADWFSL
jgi:hypothetical protein